jgi:hypothetical protein
MAEDNQRPDDAPIDEAAESGDGLIRSPGGLNLTATLDQPLPADDDPEEGPDDAEATGDEDAKDEDGPGGDPDPDEGKDEEGKDDDEDEVEGFEVDLGVNGKILVATEDERDRLIADRDHNRSNGSRRDAEVGELRLTVNRLMDKLEAQETKEPAFDEEAWKKEAVEAQAKADDGDHTALMKVYAKHPDFGDPLKKVDTRLLEQDQRIAEAQNTESSAREGVANYLYLETTRDGLGYPTLPEKQFTKVLRRAMEISADLSDGVHVDEKTNRRHAMISVRTAALEIVGKPSEVKAPDTTEKPPKKNAGKRRRRRAPTSQRGGSGDADDRGDQDRRASPRAHGGSVNSFSTFFDNQK